MTILESVIASIQDALEEETKEIKADFELINDVGLDSLQLVNILLDLEDKLDLCLDYDDLDFDEIITVQDLVEYLESEA